ncbi:hypothetical protein NL676_003016 [Syzygium grande]|nr:hypothetical protein NL676_003016 [Syzygium grande]
MAWMGEVAVTVSPGHSTMSITAKDRKRFALSTSSSSSSFSLLVRWAGPRRQGHGPHGRGARIDLKAGLNHRDPHLTARRAH